MPSRKLFYIADCACRICDLADKYGALVFVDDCHATGFFGPSGRGTAEHFGVESRVDIINSTLGKALGGAAGGYTTGSKNLVTVLRQKSRPYLFSNSLPPPVVGAAAAALDLVMTKEGADLRKRLMENMTIFRERMTEAGFTLKVSAGYVLEGDPCSVLCLQGNNHPIIPVMLKDARLASEFADAMLKQGIYVVGFSFPVVPKGEARIRVQLSAGHSAQDVHKAVDAFIKIGKAKAVLAQ
jgi:glycine C-acetyltransferase